MPKTKISEFSATPGNNTDIDGINIAEGCPPSGINDAIRELMSQLKDFQSGGAGDSMTAVGTLAAKGTSSSGADLQLYEDTDNGTNYVALKAPSSIASNVTWTLPSADGTNGQALITNGSGTLSFSTISASPGGSTTQVQYNNAGAFAGSANMTFDGTSLTLGGNPTLSAGTANGVAYLNGSKVLTTGSALTFDATNGFVTTGGASVRGTSGPSTGVGLEITYGAVASTARLLSYDRDAAARKDIQLDGLNLLFNANGSEGMRLTSSGNLGIGTSSPTASANYKSLTISGTSGAEIYLNAGATNYGYMYVDSGGFRIINPQSGSSSGTLQFYTSNTERMRLDASGILGLGVTPNTWGSPITKAFQVGNASVSNYSGETNCYLTGNAYYNSGWKYVVTKAASMYQFEGLNHTWSSAASGTAGTAITFTDVLAVSKDKSLALQGATTQTGTGITFPATQSASSDANTLDDYEEGTFTATLKGSTTDPTTPVTSTAKYTKIGNVVYIQITFDGVNTTGASGNITVTSLPFTPATGHRCIGAVFSSNMATFTGTMVSTIDNNLTTVYFYGISSNAANGAVTHNAGTSRTLHVTGFYYV